MSFVRCSDSLHVPLPDPDGVCTFEAITASGIARRRLYERCMVETTGVGSYDEVLELDSSTLFAALAPSAPCAAFRAHAVHSHVDISLYYEQLRVLARTFPRPRVFIFSLESLAADGGVPLWAKLFQFLALPLYGPDGYADEATLRATLEARANTASKGRGPSSQPTADGWRHVQSFFAPYNRKLSQWLHATDDGRNTVFDPALWEPSAQPGSRDVR